MVSASINFCELIYQLTDDWEQAGAEQAGAEQAGAERSDAVQNQPIAPNPNKPLFRCILELPAELRVMIWAEAAGMGAVTTNRRRHCQLNCETNEISYQQDKTTKRQIIPVYPNGMNYIFWFKISEEPILFQQFLWELKDKVIFMLRSPDAIPPFVEKLKRFFNKPEDIPGIEIAIPLFSSQDMRNASYLSRFLPRKVVHGFSEKAFEHVKSWMDAVQNVPSQIKVEVTMHRPWMDYRSLRGLSEQMRRGNRTVKVRINEPAWMSCPRRDLHIGLTVGALHGVTMAQQSTFTESEAKALVDLGCRGFRA